ncbi:MAG: hypothetical protein KatS3mg050_1723 [Litorilinea sp.]|nr:MAG: hypothetical protein KatS3mg050_1723 [Litorilinea sp.]
MNLDALVMRSARLLLLVILATSVTILSVHAQDAPAEPFAPSSRIYLPMVANTGNDASGARAECHLSPQEQQIADLLTGAPEQQRPEMRCHPVLATVARQRAEDMANRGYFGHVTPEGYGPNYLVMQAGFDLPDWYDLSPDGNNIESIAAGYGTAQATWEQWMGSSGHRVHLLGEHPFYREQVEFGAGYAANPNSPYVHYWVILTAPPEGE